jgi:hypothetical protein
LKQVFQIYDSSPATIIEVALMKGFKEHGGGLAVSHRLFQFLGSGKVSALFFLLPGINIPCFMYHSNEWRADTDATSSSTSNGYIT